MATAVFNKFQMTVGIFIKIIKKGGRCAVGQLKRGKKKNLHILIFAVINPGTCKSSRICFGLLLVVFPCHFYLFSQSFLRFQP